MAPLSPPDGLADGPRLGLDPAPSLSGHQQPAVPLELDLPFLLQKCLFISLPIPASPCVPFLLTGSSPHPSPPFPPASLLHNFGSGSPFLRSRLPSPSELALNCHRPHLPSCWRPVTPCPWRLLGPADPCYFPALSCSKHQVGLHPLPHRLPPLPSQGTPTCYGDLFISLSGPHRQGDGLT